LAKFKKNNSKWVRYKALFSERKKKNNETLKRFSVGLSLIIGCIDKIY